MSTTPVQIIRKQDGAFVDAVLHTELEPTMLVEAEMEWGPIRWETVKKLRQAGRGEKIPQHWHWNWGKKSLNLQFLAYRCFGIKCDGKWQGLLMVKLAGMEARLQPDKGKPLVYIDYLESAPWNLREMVDTPLYGGIGPVLMWTAVQLSYDEGFHGRIGLHALPQAERFYRDTCGMHSCGPDASYENLPYYEMTREIATSFTSDVNGGPV
jgi:hypothetical protein